MTLAFLISWIKSFSVCSWAKVREKNCVNKRVTTHQNCCTWIIYYFSRDVHWSHFGWNSYFLKSWRYFFVKLLEYKRIDHRCFANSLWKLILESVFLLANAFWLKEEYLLSPTRRILTFLSGWSMFSLFNIIDDDVCRGTHTRLYPMRINQRMD